MNAAFLLVTSACLAGQVADKKMVAAPAAPVVASSCSTCNDGCGCESFGHRLCDRLRGMFNRNSGCDTCQTSTCAAPACNTCASHSCNTGCRQKLFNFQPRCHDTCNTCNTCSTVKTSCSTCNSCDTCNEGFLSRLKARFSHGDCGCSGGCGTSCSSCGASGCAPSSAPPMGEKIEAPKKMPPAPINAPKKQEVRIDNPPMPIPQIATTPTAIPSVPVAPGVEVTPIPAPRVDAGRRDPF